MNSIKKLSIATFKSFVNSRDYSIHKFVLTKMKAHDGKKFAYINVGDSFQGEGKVYTDFDGEYCLAVGRDATKLNGNTMHTSPIVGVVRDTSSLLWYIKTKNSIYKLELMER